MVPGAVCYGPGSRMVSRKLPNSLESTSRVNRILFRVVYTQNLWSFLDVGFVILYVAYLVLRIYGWFIGDLEPGEQALDVMAIAAPVLIPRLAFNVLSDSMVFLSLRAMMGDFAVLTALSAWCFAGFLISLQWLSPGAHDPM